MNKAILILLALAAVQTSATKVNECGWIFDGPVDDKSVTLAGCDKPPCEVKRGEVVSYSVKFTPDSYINQLTVRVKAYKFKIPQTLIEDTSACSKIFKTSDNSPAACPLSPRVEYIYKDSFSIPNYYPAVEGSVKLFLLSDSEEFKCFVADANLV